MSLILMVAFARRSDAQLAIENRFTDLDANNDDKLTTDELPQPAIFKKLDLNGDGEITKLEARKAFLVGALEGILSVPSEGDNSESSEKLSEPTMLSETPVRQGPKLLIPGEHGVGSFVADLAFTDVDGKQHYLSEFATDQAVVIAMTSTSCPLSKKYFPTLQELAQTYSSQGIRFVLANPVAADNVDQMKSLQSQLGDLAIYVFDEDNSLARALGAQTTTDVIVLDPSRTITYHGAIDDQYGFGFSLDAPRHTYLIDALDALLDGRQPLVTATAAPGCVLNLKPNNANDNLPTYHGDISRLVQRHCVECHRDDGVGPFALDTYDDIVSHAPMIREVVQRGSMPPWFAVSKDPEQPSPWLNDRSLSNAEKQSLIRWLESDQREGDPKDAPRPKTFPGGWSIGEPDAVFQFATPVEVKATGTMPYKNVVVETNLSEDKWVQAIEVRPSNAAVVHHVLVFAQGADDAEGQRDNDADERSGYWGIYVPGNSSLVYPDGYAKRLPKGAKLRFQMHYTPNGTATEDSTRIGLVYAKETPKHEIRVAGIVNPRLSIPPGADNHKEVASLRVPSDVQVLAFLPHMHLRGKAARYEVVTSTGTETLLDVPNYDFNWQLLYRYAEPLSLKSGDTLRFTAWYDNSENNPANPDPTRTVRWGQQTFDEMHLGYVEYIVPGAKPGEAVDGMRRAQAIDAIRGREGSVSGGILFGQLDINDDGEITKAEVRERMPDNANAAGPIFDRLDRDQNGKLDKTEFEALQTLLKR